MKMWRLFVATNNPAPDSSHDQPHLIPTLEVSPVAFLPSFRMQAIALLIAFGLLGGWTYRASALNPEPPLPNPADPVGTMGICYHYVDGQAPTAAEVSAIKAAGFTWIRTDLKWNNVENPGQQGNYYWGYFDTVYNAFASQGIRVMFILDYANPNYDNGVSVNDATGRAAYAKFAAAAAVHYNSLGGGVVFEIYNEPENFWTLTSAQYQDSYSDQQALIDQLYPQMALPAAQAIKQALPSAHIIGPGAGWWDANLMNSTAAVSTTGGVFQYLDGDSFHQYGSVPEGFSGNFALAETFYESLAPYNPRLSSFITEQGYGSNGVTPAQQAQYAARTFLYGVYSHLGLNVYYVWHEPGVYNHQSGETYLNAQDNAYGIVDNIILNNNPNTVNMTPKPAYNACKTYAQQLSGFLYENRVSTGDANVFCLAFAKGNLPCYVLWSSSGYSYPAVLNLANGAYTLTSYDGSTSKSITVTNGSLPLTLDGGPQYLVMNSAPAALPPLPSITLPSSVTSPNSFVVLDSPGGAYTLTMQTDGNLVVTHPADNTAIWASGSYDSGPNSGARPYTATLQATGNLVITNTSGGQVWASNTANKGVAPYVLTVQDNGTVVIKDSGGAVIFNTGTVLPPPALNIANIDPSTVSSGTLFYEMQSANKLFSLNMQADGNLVEYNGNRGVWSSNTSLTGTTPYQAVLRTDGNLVVTQLNGTVVWSTNTAGKGVAPYHLDLQNNGVLAIYDSQSRSIFATASVANPGQTPASLIPSFVNSQTSFPQLASPNGQYELIMQGNGNLVEYNGNLAVWASNTYNTGKAPYRVTVQSDGNLVVYDANNSALWYTATYGQGVGPYQLAINDSGNIQLRDSHNKVLYATGCVLNPTLSNGFTVPSSVKSAATASWIVSPHGRYELLMQTDGTLVEYDGGTAVWTSKPTNVTGGPYRTVMQGDGNLVTYQGNGYPIWSTGTYGQGVSPYRLDVQDDGNIVIYDSTNTFISKTRDQ